MDEALSDIKVLDFTHYTAGPYCTKLLADFGADVLKVERPDEGDPARHLGPFPHDQSHLEKSGLFLQLNTNKRSITLNLKTGAGVEIARRLAREVDIVVESFQPGTMTSFGLDYPSLREVNPGLVMTSISNFGQTGPYRHYRGSEIIFYGMGGEMISTGLPDREPVKLGGKVGQYQAGTIAAVATLGAFLCARYQGVGQHVDISIMETQLGSQDRRMPALVGYQYAGLISDRRRPGGNSYPKGIYPCKDGYVEFISPGRFDGVRAMMGYPPFLEDSKWYTPEAQISPELEEEFEAHFLAWCLEHTKSEVWHKAQACRVISGPLNTIKDLAEDPAFEQRGVFTTMEHPEAGVLKVPGRPFLMGATPWELKRPAPRLGEHNLEVLTSLDYTSQQIQALKQDGVI